MQKQDCWNKLKNILCIRPDNLGDVIMTGPAIRALKESCPGRKITLLASRAGSPVARFIPAIDDVIKYDPFWVKNEAADSVGAFNDMAQYIRKQQFDGAVIFTVYSQNPLPAAMLCYLAGIPNVAAYCRENPYHLINHWIPDTEPLFDIKHEVMRQLDLAAHLGAVATDDRLSLTVSTEAVAGLSERLQQLLLPDKPFVILHPGVSEAKRQYAPALFAQAATGIINELDCQVLLTGSASERCLTDRIQQQIGSGAYSVAGDFTLEELIALIKAAPVVVANNTGPVHIAAAVGTPVVVLYALTNPQHTPWKVDHIILPFEVPPTLQSKNTIIKYANRKAFPKEVPMVQPAQIVQAVKSLLANNRVTAKPETIRL